MQDNYSLAYAKSDDGLEYGDYLECDNVIHFIDNSDSGSYKFVLMSKDGEIICEYSEIVTIEVSTLVTEQTITIIEAIKKLNDKEKMIMRKRYFEGRTQVEIAEEIGISQAQVSRLEKDAIKHIRRIYK